MRVELVNITPEIATEYLKRNSNNRELRPSHVAELHLAFKRGEYVPTHQGIAFGEDGYLKDGQHRLTAIAMLEEGVFPMLVTYGLTEESYRGMDVKVAVRSNYDVLRIDRVLGQTANFMFRFVTGEQPTPPQVIPYVGFVQPYLEKLMQVSSRNIRLWSSSASRAAAIISLSMGKDEKYVLETYRALVMQDYGAMAPITHILVKQHEAGKISCHKGWRENDFIARLAKVYDIEFSKSTKLVIPDQATVLEPLKEHVAKLLTPKGQKASAARASIRKQLLATGDWT